MRKILLASCFLACTIAMTAQDITLQHRAEKAVNDYLQTYSAKNTEFVQQPGLKKLIIDDRTRTVVVNTTEYGAQQ